MPTIERKLQLTLHELEKWCDRNGFKFSTTKTVGVHFCNRRALHPDPVLTLNKAPLPFVPETKFLGVLFDKKLTFIPHLKHVRTKCNQSLNILKVVSHLEWGADFKTLRTLYRTLIRPQLDYGCIVYGSARSSYTKMLDPIQNHALRLCLGAFRTSPVISMHIEANEPPLWLRRQKLALQYYCKLQAYFNNPTTKHAAKLLNPIVNKPTAIYPFGTRMKTLTQEAELEIPVIATVKQPEIEPWLIQKPIVHFHIHSEKEMSFIF